MLTTWFSMLVLWPCISTHHPPLALPSSLLIANQLLGSGIPFLIECVLLLQVTRERIRQLENKAMSKLKALESTGALKAFVNGEAWEAASDEVGWKANIKRTK